MNINTFFVDTGYFIALEASDDKNHTSAKNHWQAFVRSRPTLVTTSLAGFRSLSAYSGNNLLCVR